MQDEPKKQNDITYFGVTDARGKEVKFGIRKEDRLRHMYTIGKTGMGKSTLLENMAIQDIQNGEGFAFLDPHGKTAELLLEFVPEHRIKDVIYFAPFDMENPIALNVLEDTAPGDESSRSIRSQFIVSGLMSTFKKIWKDQWSARMEYILNYTLLALLEIPEATLLDVNRMLSDKAYRKDVISQLKEPTVKAYWEKEFASMTDKMIAEAVPAIQNKVGQFISNALIRNIIGQKTSSFDFRKAMDEKKIIIFNLSIGRIGEDAVNLLGSLFVTKIYLAAMSRANISDRDMKDVPNFYLYVDEFQNFINDSFAQILSQARKYKLGLIVAHQYVKQMTEVVHDAIFGNVGTMIAFRIGADDAEAFEKEFKPTFLPEDFTNLGRFQMYLNLMIDSVTSAPFSATGMGPYPIPEEKYVNEIIDSSRKLYSHPRAEVEAHILKWTLGGGDNTDQKTERTGPKNDQNREQRNNSMSGQTSDQKNSQNTGLRNDRVENNNSRNNMRNDSRNDSRPPLHDRLKNDRPNGNSFGDSPRNSIRNSVGSKPEERNFDRGTDVRPIENKPQTKKPIETHNPFKSAFGELINEKDLGKDVEVQITKDTETQNTRITSHVKKSPILGVPEVGFDTSKKADIDQIHNNNGQKTSVEKKEIEEQKLKDVLGMTE
jgi:hypothetical protein